MFSKQSVLLGAAALAVAAVTGCSHGQSASSSANSQPKAKASAVAPAAAKAKTQITGCVNKTGITTLVTPSGRTALVGCLKSLVPPAKQAQFKDCLTKAAKNDKIWTKAGRSKFESTDGPNCVNAAA
jgi:hypothetical protein